MYRLYTGDGKAFKKKKIETTVDYSANPCIAAGVYSSF
jgi:hypothetical protein